jgi:cell division protein FtsW
MRTKSFLTFLESWGLDLPDGGTFVNPGSTDRNRVRLGFDIWLLAFTAVLLIFGLVIVYSASADFSYKEYLDETQIFTRQILWVILGLIAAICMFFLRYQAWRRYVLVAMIGSLVLMFYVALAGDSRLGATRSLFAGSFQPSELIKLVLVLYISVWLHNHKDQMNEFSLGIIPIGIILGIVGMSVAMQSDVSATATVAVIGGLLFFLSGGKLRLIAGILLLAVFVIIVAYFMIGKVQDRIDPFLAGLDNLQNSSHHVRLAMQSFVNGGFFGVGIGKGTVKLLGLPYPHTDSIFAVVGEETGVVGASIMVVLFLGILWRGVTIAGRAPDMLGRLMAAGLTFWIIFEAFLNMAVLLNLAPFAGNALPFISSGGSSMVVSLMAIGILLNISRQCEQVQTQEEQTFNAVVDLRGRDRRRRVSGAIHSASAGGTYADRK